jgi:hypothetical protein
MNMYYINYVLTASVMALITMTTVCLMSIILSFTLSINRKLRNKEHKVKAIKGKNGETKKIEVHENKDDDKKKKEA